MAYGRRRGYKRRYRRRFGSKRYVKGKIAAPGSAMGQLSRVPRLRRFMQPIHRFKLIRLELDLELRLPQLMPWSSITATGAAAGRVAMYHFQPFCMDVTQSYIGNNTLDTGGSTNQAVVFANYGIFGLQSTHYKWMNEVQEQWNEYQPMAYKYDIVVNPEKDNVNRECSTRVGVFLSYRDRQDDAVIPVLQSGFPDHDQLNTFCSFPDVKWAHVPRNHNQRWPRFSGYVRARDYSGTGQNTFVGDTSSLRSNWFTIGDTWTADTQNKLPNLCIFAGNFENAFEDAFAGREGSLRVKFTLFARVRQLVDKDPHTTA